MRSGVVACSHMWSHACNFWSCESNGALFRSLITMGSPPRGLMFFARLAYLSELSVSSNVSCAGEQLAIMVVRQLPPSLWWRSVGVRGGLL